MFRALFAHPQEALHKRRVGELGITDGVSVSLVSSRTQFGVSINVWRLAGDTLNITRSFNFLYCNHQVRRDILITLYIT
jgi:hypothetical protein